MMILTDDQLTAALATIADRLEVDLQVLPRYSGRAMYGRECLAVVGGPTAGAALLFALAEITDRDPWEMLAQVERHGGWRNDDFGLDGLQYWPSVQVQE